MRRVALAAILLVPAACGTSDAPTDIAPQPPPVKRRIVVEAADPTVGLESAIETSRPPRRKRASRNGVRRKVTSDHGIPPSDVWGDLARCESGMRQVTPGPFHSYFQWNLATYRSVGGEGMPEDHDYGYQRALAEKLQARSGWGQWPACSRKLGLR